VAVARVLFVAIAAGSVAVGTAIPASARPVDPPMYGIYTYHQDGVPDSDMPGYGGDARKVNGLWTWPVTKDKGATCPDGSKAPANYSYAWDQATLDGTVTVLTSDECGAGPA
jgi:hypothetical protein